MWSLNLSLDTFIKYEPRTEFTLTDYKKPRFIEDSNKYIIELIDNNLKVDGYIHIDKTRKGVIIGIIEKFMAIKDYQKSLEKSNNPNYSRSIYNNVKVVINGIYGLQAQNGNRLNNKYIPALITF